MKKLKLKKLNKALVLLMVLGIMSTVMPVGSLSFAATSDYTVVSYSVDDTDIKVDETFKLTITFNGNVDKVNSIIENIVLTFIATKFSTNSFYILLII